MAKAKSFTPVVAFALFASVLLIGAVFYSIVEGLTPVDALYFAAMTMTTVGYGDFVPKTDIGKLFTAVYAFVGIGMFLGFAALMFQGTLGHVQRISKSLKNRRRSK